MRGVSWFIILSLLVLTPVMAQEPIKLTVTDPYLDLRSGPGGGYPIVRIVKQGEWITVLKRKNNWFEIALVRGETGWVAVGQLERTLDTEGALISIDDLDQEDFDRRNVELAVMSGDFNGARAMELSALYYTTENIAFEGFYSIGLGSFSSTRAMGLAIQHQPFPGWHIAPYFSVGGGRVEIEPKTTLVQSESRQESFVHGAIGLRSYISQRFLLRLQYKEFVLFNDDDNNEEIKEWKIGFAAFF